MADQRLNLPAVLGLIVLASHGLLRPAAALMCDRTAGMLVQKTPGSGKFEVIINGDPDKYVPGAIYTVRIQGQGDPTEKFSGFLLVAEPAYGNSGHGSAGSLRLKDDSLARFSEFCPDAVKHASEVAKPDVQVLWIAPPVSAGCVIFRATVIKNPHQWYMDDDNLTKQLCPEDDEGQEESETSEPCRACDEAKYELTFEGLWSSLTHPRHFPSNSWTANFSDIIGASHSPTFRVWDYGKIASEGVRHVAESGDPRDLERELKEQSESIRTIIKARGLRHTNFNGLKTFAVFRADKNHNLISFISKIDPSPDWFVGVSGLNLCLRNGSWLTEKEMNLFPIDAGSDSGVTYMSPDQPSAPRIEIRRLVWSSDVNSPFYEPDGNMLKPFAKLRLQQQRSYKRGSCENTFRQAGGSNDYGDDYFYDDSPDKDRPECSMHPWSQWTPCSPTCGKGTRKKSRKYVNEATAREARCSRKDAVDEICYNAQSCKGQSGSSYYDEFNPSLSGGGQRETGYNVETRSPYTPPLATRSPYTPVESRPTAHNVGEGQGPGDPMDDVCGTTEFRPWSVCSDPCGSGVRYQLRTFLRPSQAKRHKCETQVKLKNMEQCPRTPECRDGGPTPKVEEGCEVTGWGPWQPCSQTCGRGVKARYRVYKFPNIDHRKCTLPMQDTDTCEGFLPHCPPEKTRDDCLEPRVAGECRESFSRWYFDQVKLRCQEFTYTGCKASRNNFESRDACDALCGPLRDNLSSGHGKTRHSKPASGGSSWGQHQPAYHQPMSTSRNSGYNSPYANGYVHSSQGQSFTTYPSPRSESQNYQGFSPSTGGQGYQSFSPSTGQRSEVGQGYQSFSQGHGSEGGYNNYQSLHNGPYSDGPVIDCKMSPWSPWSRCSVKCGRGWKYQSRYVQVFNENGGEACPKLTERSRGCRGAECPRHGPNRQYHNTYTNDFDEYSYQD